MSDTALIIAAHGSGEATAAIDQVKALARKVQDRGRFDEVTPTFHLGEPTFAQVLDTVTASTITVVPLMTSEGHFNQVVLPRELARNRRFADVRLTQTDPVGTHPAIVEICKRRIEVLEEQFGFQAKDATIAVVGHGTKRHENSSTATERLADALRTRAQVGEVLTAFLDDDPTVESLPPRSSRPIMVVLPFLIGGGAHTYRDLPRRLGLAIRGGRSGPMSGRIGEKQIICDRAIGEDPGIVEIILDLAQEPIAPPS